MSPSRVGLYTYAVCIIRYIKTWLVYNNISVAAITTAQYLDLGRTIRFIFILFVFFIISFIVSIFNYVYTA
jgi:hypothetical protein